MATERQKMIDILRNKYPTMFLKTTEQFNGGTDGIWTSGEDGIEAKDGHELFNYYSQDYKEVRYQFGVHKEIRELLKKNGWWAEWYDAGTIMLWVE